MTDLRDFYLVTGVHINGYIVGSERHDTQTDLTVMNIRFIWHHLRSMIGWKRLSRSTIYSIWNTGSVQDNVEGWDGDITLLYLLPLAYTYRSQRGVLTIEDEVWNTIRLGYVLQGGVKGLLSGIFRKVQICSINVSGLFIIVQLDNRW